MNKWFSKWGIVLIHATRATLLFATACANYVLYKTIPDTALVMTLSLGWLVVAAIVYREVKK